MYASIRVSQYKISKFEKKTSYTYWNRTFLLLACQTQEEGSPILLPVHQLNLTCAISSKMGQMVMQR